MNDATQTGVAMAFIAAACTIAGQFIGWLRDRDKLRYDKDLADLKSQNSGQAAQITVLSAGQKACEEKHQACEQEQQSLKTDVRDIKLALAQMQANPTRPQ